MKLILPVTTTSTSWSTPDGWGQFRPNGDMTLWQAPGTSMPNPARFAVTEPLWSALFVGLSVGSRPRWKDKDVIDVVAGVREEQTGDPSASFVSQRGIYRHESDGKVITENSVQVIILNLPELKTSRQQFREQMVTLAEKLAEELQQELVIVELQRGGVVKETIGVSGAARARRRST